MTPAAWFHVLRCKPLCALGMALLIPYMCALKSLSHLSHAISILNLTSGTGTGSSTKKSGLVSFSGSRRSRRYREEIKGKKICGSDSLWAATCHIYATKCDWWRLSPIVFRNFRIIMTPLDLGMFLFCRGWPLNLSAGTCATQERQRVTSFCRTANPIMDSVCAFAIFGKCQQMR